SPSWARPSEGGPDADEIPRAQLQTSGARCAGCGYFPSGRVCGFESRRRPLAAVAQTAELREHTAVDLDLGHHPLDATPVKAAALFGVALAARGEKVDLYGFADGVFRHKVRKGASVIREV